MVVNVAAALDALFKLVHPSPSTPSSWLEQVLHKLALSTAVLMDPPQELVGGHDSLAKLSSCVNHIGSLISSLDLKEIVDNRDMIDHIESAIPLSDLDQLIVQVEDLFPAIETYDCRPDPSDIEFRTTHQLDFVDHLVQNLDQLTRANINSVGPLKYYILQLRQSLHSVSCGLMEIPESCKEEADLKDLIQSITGLAFELEYVIDSFLIRDIPMWYCLNWIRRILVQLEPETEQLQIVIQTVVSSTERGGEWVEDLAPLDILFKHFDDECPFTGSKLRDIFIDLAICTAVLMDPPQELVGDDTLEKLGSCVGNIGCIISLFDLGEIDKQYMLEHIEFLIRFSGLKEILMKVVREALNLSQKIYENREYPSDIEFLYPDQLDFLYHVVKKLDHLMKAKANSIGPLKYLTLQLRRQLHSLSFGLMEIPESRKEEAHLKDLTQSSRVLAYQSEYVIDSFLIGDIPMCHCLILLKDIFLPKLERLMVQLGIRSGDIRNVLSNIMDMQSPEFKIIPSVNKTETELTQILNHHKIIRQFRICSRSLVASYKGREKEVFLQLLLNASYRNISSVGFEDENMSENELRMSVRKLLAAGVFFIILEDVQDLDALKDIARVFPSVLNRSMVLLTNPSLELAIQCRRNDFFNKIFEDHTSISQSNNPIMTSHIKNKSTIDDDVIGFKVEAERILGELIGGPRKLRIISIVGMAGQGKTTLAKKLCRDPSIVDYFHTLSRCCVTQVYKKRELLLELLGEIVQHSNIVHNKNEEELAEMLYKNLKGRRFLILLDDLWNIDVWNDLARCFPNDNNGSRILFTTRIQELASQAKSGSILQSLSPLSNDESWELLINKVFQKESYPLELLDVGRQIAESCRGLPLSVVLVGGLLAKMDKKVEVLQVIAKTLSSRILIEAQSHGKDTIELSYKHLSDSLKACFLYFGAYLEDKEIHVRKLVQLWVAEGFVEDTELKSVEDMAMDYLMDLVGRSLVMVAKKKSTGGVKSCRMHDLLHEFCLTKAREENFLLQINGYDEHFPSSKDSLDYDVYPNCFCSSTPISYDLHRLSIYSKRNHFIMVKPSGPFVRSLLFFARSDMCPSYSYDVSFIFHNLKLLKILDLEEINIGNSFEAVHVLVLLRYLAIQSDLDFIPSSIVNLWHLETFFFKGLSAKVVKVPNSIWDMDKLRHVHINSNVSFDLESHRLENSSNLDNLQTFSTPSLAYGDDMLKLLKKLRGIQKLKCIFLDSWDDARDCNRFPELEFLSQLVSLKVFYSGVGLYPCEFNFPSNVKKVTLTNFRMPWCEVSQLVALSNLEVLKLLDNAFEGKTWEMEDDQVFSKLKFLKLKALNVVKWTAFYDHFPCLECLILHKCEQLEEIPPGIGDITTLQMIEVMWCNPSTATSAKKIQEEQLDFGNDELKIHVHPEVWEL